MNVLFVTSEALPLSKTGGLADVAFSLPKALVEKGVDIRVITPYYGTIPQLLMADASYIGSKLIEMGWRNQYMGIHMIKFGQVTYYLVDNEYYFNRDQLYGYYDDGERFSYFSRAVLEAIDLTQFQPDIIHLNDWHTAIVPYLLKVFYANDSRYLDVKTVLTIHNLKYQGIFERNFLGDIFGHEAAFHGDDRLAFGNGVNFMKAGIRFADEITTVSESYAEEILTPYFGEKLEWDLNYRRQDLIGITNGIDYDDYNPSTDERLFLTYDIESSAMKKDNKIRLQSMTGLAVEEDTPLVAIVSRLVDSKGLDLIERIMPELFDLGIQMIVLGKGDYHYENLFKYYAQRFPNRLKVFVEFNAVLAQRIYASADLFLMPSRFEPCGLGQLIALRYGTIPIVRETGGLKDTVIPYNRFTEEGTGFSFSNYNAHEFLDQVYAAIELYKSDAKGWDALVKRAMSADHSWNRSALRYRELYLELGKRR
jgi:starch synthase